MKTKIIIDSTVNLMPEYNDLVQTVPLTVRFKDKEYIDGVTIDNKRFYEMLIESDVLPTTSQATPFAFMKEFDKIKENGDSAVVITISSKLSGTHQSAIIAAEDYDNIYVVDSGSAAVGSGILTELACKLANEGLDAKTIAEKLEEEKKNIVIVALVDTLEYLKKGGRISKSVALAGSVLKIKPLLSLVDGEIKMLGKARGSKVGYNLLMEEIQKTGGVDFQKPVMFGYTGLSDTSLLKYIEHSHHIWDENLTELHYTTMGSVIGTHVGPGAVAVAFFKK